MSWQLKHTLHLRAVNHSYFESHRIYKLSTHLLGENPVFIKRKLKQMIMQEKNQKIPFCMQIKKMPSTIYFRTRWFLIPAPHFISGAVALDPALPQETIGIISNRAERKWNFK